MVPEKHIFNSASAKSPGCAEHVLLGCYIYFLTLFIWCQYTSYLDIQYVTFTCNSSMLPFTSIFNMLQFSSISNILAFTSIFNMLPLPLCSICYLYICYKLEFISLWLKIKVLCFFEFIPPYSVCYLYLHIQYITFIFTMFHLPLNSVCYVYLHIQCYLHLHIHYVSFTSKFSMLCLPPYSACYLYLQIQYVTFTSIFSILPSPSYSLCFLYL